MTEDWNKIYKVIDEMTKHELKEMLELLIKHERISFEDITDMYSYIILARA